jgi:Spy/CpxP family protein refolding chaperone
MKSGFKSLVLTGLLASAGFATFAQTAPAPDAATSPPMMGASGPRGGMGHGGGLMGMRGQMDPAKMEAMVAKHHAELKAKLKITADQEGAWTTFTAAMKPPAGWMDHKRPDRAEMDKLTTPERIDKMHALRTQHMADMNAAMDKRGDVTKAFYAVLNADQKKIFDAEHARIGGRRGEHRHGDGGHGKDGDKPAAAK